MNECGVCGILYLAGGSCPACGSQIQKRSDDFQDAEMVLPTEVPGLDEAAEAWYDLEGMEPPAEEEMEESTSSLPFGFGGESLTNVSRLPFGIGSHRDGIPFDVERDSEAKEETINPLPATVPAKENEVVETKNNHPSVEPVPAETQVNLPTLPEENIHEEETTSKTTEPVRITAIPLTEATPVETEFPEIPLDTSVNVDIFTQDDDVIEVVFSDLEDTIVHVDHGVVDSFIQPEVVEYAEKTFTPFDLHPARAMTVQASNDASLKALVEAGFVSIGQGDWRGAARSFQRVLASVPSDVGAMNNYGISLLQSLQRCRIQPIPLMFQMQQHNLKLQYSL